MPERQQCPVFSRMPSSLQCVMEEGHAPLGKGPDGQVLDHNFGGLGPYTPELVAAAGVDTMRITPPRALVEVSQEAVRYAQEPSRPSLGELLDQVFGLLPPHAFRDPMGNPNYQWTTPRGLWELIYDSRDPQAAQIFTIKGPKLSVTLHDHRFEHVRTVLIALGAIEAPDA